MLIFDLIKFFATVFTVAVILYAIFFTFAPPKENIPDPKRYTCTEWIDYVDASPAALGCGDCEVERIVMICEDINASE